MELPPESSELVTSEPSAPLYTNYPRFMVFIDPRPLDFPLRETWYPPKHQDDFIGHLVRHGFHPMVNGLKQPSVDEVRALCGFALLDDMETLVRCDQYNQGKILCIQWYNEPLDDDDLEVVLNYCAPFYGIGTSRSYVTEDELRLIQQNLMTPPPALPILSASSSFGDRISIPPTENVDASGSGPEAPTDMIE